MSFQFQNQLLNFMESGRVKVDQQKKQYDFEIKGARLIGYQSHYSRGSGSSSYPDIQKKNS
jgi:hypothetical protein